MNVRHYGLKILDKVEITRWDDKKIQGFVSKFDSTDNNRCYINYKGVLIKSTCEECTKLSK